jgi:cytochrome b561
MEKLMQFKSTPDRYGAVAVLIHWLAAALIVALLASGFRAASTLDPITKSALLRFHAVGGIAVLALTLGRIAWWLFGDHKPLPVAGTASLLNRAAAAVHTLFYVVVLGMAASGIGMMVLSGAGAVLFGPAGGTLPDFWSYLPRIPHGLGARLFIALLVLHVGGALYHQFIRGDRLLARMGIGR